MQEGFLPFICPKFTKYVSGEVKCEKKRILTFELSLKQVEGGGVGQK
jgi:hypothetical protein